MLNYPYVFGMKKEPPKFKAHYHKDNFPSVATLEASYGHNPIGIKYYKDDSPEITPVDSGDSNGEDEWRPRASSRPRKKHKPIDLISSSDDDATDATSNLPVVKTESNRDDDGKMSPENGGN
jgi:hypothetical protein